MSAYLVILRDRGSFEVEADFYGRIETSSCSVPTAEVWRVPMFEVSSISKAE